jgi:hypothetical protein
MQTMKIWVLRRIQGNEGSGYLDRAPVWNVVSGFVVRAKSAQQARQYAAANGMDEGKHTWLDPKYSTCRVLPVDGPAEVILRDANAT